LPYILYEQHHKVDNTAGGGLLLARELEVMVSWYANGLGLFARFTPVNAVLELKK
jgi:hypothetical protein